MNTVADLVVDVHTHIYPAVLVNYLRNRQMPPFLRLRNGKEYFQLFDGDIGVPFTAAFSELDVKLEFMDAVGIDTSIVSVGNPWLDLEPGEASMTLATSINAGLLQMVGTASTRLAAMCVLPNAAPRSAVGCIEDLSRDRRCVGIVSGTEICGRSFDDPALEPVWSALCAAELPLFVHPRSGLASGALRGYGQVLTVALGFPFSTTLALAKLLLSGVLVRFPDLRVLAAHGGGTLPYLLGRLRRAAAIDRHSLEYDFDILMDAVHRSIFVDTVLYGVESVDAAIRALGPSNVLFGTDHPFPIEDAKLELGRARQIRTEGTEVVGNIEGGNALRLFRIGKD